MFNIDQQRRSELCPEKLIEWVRSAYMQALNRYGPAHPLTRSWLAELKDMESFAAHFQG